MRKIGTIEMDFIEQYLSCSQEIIGDRTRAEKGGSKKRKKSQNLEPL
jgi:hypothetical protein